MSVRENLKAYLDRELSEQEASAVRAALEGDPSLRRELEEMESIGEEVRRLAADPQPVGLEATLENLNRSARRGAWWPRWAVATACIAVVGFGLLRLLGSRPAGLETVAVASKEGSASFDAPGTALAESVRLRGSEGAAPALASSDLPEEALGARRIVRTADIRLKVSDAAEALRSADNLARALGGYVAASGLSRPTELAPPIGSATLRVPTARFDEAMARLRAMGEVLTENSTADDVTLEHADVAARLKVMRAEEQQYVALLGEARTIGQVLQVRERLNQVRQEIESRDARRRTLERQSALATISATFEQRARVGGAPTGAGWAGEAWANAVNGLGATMRWLGSAAIFVLVYAPLWLPALLLAAYLRRRLM
ncbi:MAG: DUF4349 domain-containing protein [Fimbriimonadales bacterium]|nr:DUF4349 domain-containing protein [Fimbriimonadales bacterium]